MRRVVDASALISALVYASPEGGWCFDQLRSTELFAPALLPFETANAVRRDVVRGGITDSDGAAALADLDRMRIEWIPFAGLAHRVWELRHNLTVYDASYVAAAELLDCALITLDRRLSRAAGIECEVLVAP